MDCKLCGKAYVSRTLGYCADCIKNHWDKIQADVQKVHATIRAEFKLPGRPPRASESAVQCKLCVSNCSMANGDKSYCGLRTNRDGKLVYLANKSPDVGILQWYYDPLPTNCVAVEFCPGGKGGNGCYPKYSYTEDGKPEYGYKNLAVFYEACTFNCLFCQNWHYRYGTCEQKHLVTAESLAGKVDKQTACICYFGGDPTPQLIHAIKTSELAIDRMRTKLNQQILRICWETNGSMSRTHLKKIAKISLESGGCIKFDLKAWDEHLHQALCGVTNKRTIENFEYLAKFCSERPETPFLVASTLLVPGYIEQTEVKSIAEFIASLDPTIPYSLLVFHPEFYMRDLPITSRKVAFDCLKIAKASGLKNVRIGNLHLLGIFGLF